ncbi:MAG: iron-sulfur cluster repair di-iron protein [Acidobacteriota bacterium]
MQTTPKTVAELATTFPHSIPVLEKLGIDYCCKGQQTVEQACSRRGVTPNELLDLISSAPRPSTGDRTWNGESMSEIITFIVSTHHHYTREALSILPALATRVRQVHGANHEELRSIETLVYRLNDELIPHMLKEEQVLFPYINTVEEASALGNEPPIPFFGTARNPIRMMMLEHEAAGATLQEIRKLSLDFALPVEACAKYRTLFGQIEALERDLHLHIHVENNILFPRAIEVEENTRKTPVSAVFDDNCCAR